MVPVLGSFRNVGFRFFIVVGCVLLLEVRAVKFDCPRWYENGSTNDIFAVGNFCVAAFACL